MVIDMRCFKQNNYQLMQTIKRKPDVRTSNVAAPHKKFKAETAVVRQENEFLKRRIEMLQKVIIEINEGEARINGKNNLKIDQDMEAKNLLKIPIYIWITLFIFYKNKV